MKKYRVDRDLKPHILRAVRRNYSSCHFTSGTDGTTWCLTELPSDVFHRIVLRARCEKATKETGVLYMTQAECRDGITKKELMEAHGGTHTLRIIENV